MPTSPLPRFRLVSRNPLFTGLTMYRLLILLPFLAACDIRSDRPDFTYPAASKVDGGNYPDLAVTAELAAAGDAAAEGAEERQADAARLRARANALKARAARLRAAAGR